jgi:hypothetical protein
MNEKKDVAPPAKLFFALLAQSAEDLPRVEERLAKDFGDIDFHSETFPFSHTNYYCEEMGESLVRRFVACETLIDMDEIGSIKATTNRLERFFADPETGKRRINIDPGYVSESKVVLATMKDRDHRIYLANGVFGEVTLTYRRREHSYVPLQWTYPDYREPQSVSFFNRVREIYRNQVHPKEP